MCYSEITLTDNSPQFIIGAIKCFTHNEDINDVTAYTIDYTDLTVINTSTDDFSQSYRRNPVSIAIDALTSSTAGICLLMP